MIDRVISTLKEAANIISKALHSAVPTDRQRVSVRATNVLFHGVLDTVSETLVYTVPASTRVEITEYIFSNNETTENDVVMYIVPKDEALSADHVIFPRITLASKAYEKLDSGTMMLSGWKLYLKADNVNRIVCHITGAELIN